MRRCVSARNIPSPECPLPVALVLDCFAHLMGMRYLGLTVYEVGRASIGDEPDSKQQDECGPKAHRNLPL